MMKKYLIALFLPALCWFTACQEKAEPEVKAVQIPGLKKTATSSSNSLIRTEMMTTMDMAIQRISISAPTGDVDYDYPLMMQAHHDVAISMAKLLMEKGQDSLLKVTASRLLEEREAEVKQFAAHLERLFKNPRKPNAEYAQAFAEAITDLKQHSARSEGIDRDFARLMMGHHKNAQVISEAYLKHGKDAKVRAMAEKIVKNRPEEVSYLKSWLLNHPAAQ